MNCFKSARGVIQTVAAFLALAAAATYAGQLASKPGVYLARKEPVTAPHFKVNLVLATPVSPKPQPVVILFASGDGGLSGVCQEILQHMADKGYYVAAFNSRELLGTITRSHGLVAWHVALSSMTSLFEQTKRALNQPDNTPMIITGMSRGANLVVAAAGTPALRPNILGGVAIALTRELDYLDMPMGAEQLPGIQFDEKRRLQAYPVIERMGSLPLAIIQSTNDKYVPSAESRRLLGPDTPTRRLYEIKARNHSFGGGQDTLMHDLDDAITWIVSKR
jgi:dienelactone hydrolase